MFNLFRRKAASPLSLAALAEWARSKPKPLSDSFDHFEVIGRCIQQFMDHDSFVGGLNAAPNFWVHAMTNGIQLVTHHDKRIGVVLDTTMLSMSVAGGSAGKLMLVSATTYFEQYRKQKLDWHIRETPERQQTFVAKMPFGAHNDIELVSSNGPVDTQFDGKHEPGCTMTIAVKPKA